MKRLLYIIQYGYPNKLETFYCHCYEFDLVCLHHILVHNERFHLIQKQDLETGYGYQVLI